MIKVAGLWEVGWNTPIKEAEQWEFPLRDYGVDEYIMSPVSGIGLSNPNVKEVAELGDYLQQQRANGYTIVFSDERAEQTLDSFTHPADNVIYVFGKASLSPMVAYGQPQDLSLKIMTKNNLGLLWPHQAAVLIMADRLRKGL
jgi:hypothetical protein